MEIATLTRYGLALGRAVATLTGHTPVQRLHEREQAERVARALRRTRPGR